MNSGGAKQYGLELKHRRTGEISHVLKCRGVTLDSSNEDHFNFQRFKVKCQQQQHYYQQNFNRKWSTITALAINKELHLNVIVLDLIGGKVKLLPNAVLPHTLLSMIKVHPS